MSMRKLMTVFLLLVTPKLSAYIIGYHRLFEPETQRTVDIVCDAHVLRPEAEAFPPRLSSMRFLKSLIKQMKLT